MGGGEAVSSGSTWLWSSLDHGSRSDMNRERSSHHTAHLVTLLQDSLTDSALNVSPLGFECPLKKQAGTGKLRKTREVLLIFLWMLTGQRWVPLSPVLHPFSLFFTVNLLSAVTLLLQVLFMQKEWAFGRYHTYPVWSKPLDLVLIWIEITGVRDTLGQFLRQITKIWLS